MNHRNESTMTFMVIAAALFLAFTLMFATGCSHAPKHEAEILKIDVSCEPCQKFNADLKPESWDGQICVCH